MRRWQKKNDEGLTAIRTRGLSQVYSGYPKRAVKLLEPMMIESWLVVKLTIIPLADGMLDEIQSDCCGC